MTGLPSVALIPCAGVEDHPNHVLNQERLAVGSAGCDDVSSSTLVAMSNLGEQFPLAGTCFLSKEPGPSASGMELGGVGVEGAPASRCDVSSIRGVGDEDD